MAFRRETVTRQANRRPRDVSLCILVRGGRPFRSPRSSAWRPGRLDGRRATFVLWPFDL